MSSKQANLYQKICKIMEEVPSVIKGATVKTKGTSYKGIQHDDVARALQPKFAAHKINCVVSVTDCKVERYEVQSKYGSRLVYDTQMTCSIKLINADSPEEVIAVSGFGHALDSQDKGPGKAQSYAVKMALLKLFQIPSMDDEEQRIFEGNEMSKPRASKEEMEALVKAYVDAGGGKLDELKARADKMTSEQVKNLTADFKSRAKQ